MPELPEVECVRRSLEPLTGLKVVEARFFRCEIVTRLGGASLEQHLNGETVSCVCRRGKSLAIRTMRGPVVGVHLGMTGRLSLVDLETPMEPHTHAAWRLSNGREVRFVDPRRFGGLWIAPTFEVFEAHVWSRLGPDALEVRAEDLHAARASRRSIKSLLLDQALLAGVGNIYADESLFEAGLRPTRRGIRLTGQDLDRLAEAIRAVLGRAIEAGGSTLRDYRDASGQTGRAQHAHLVYGRAGQCCVRCGMSLKKGLVSQRTTIWCSHCQR